MTFTVNKLAKLAGISVRTLHYYDQIGLLKPARIAENGYRHYHEQQLIVLQQILFFRELEFSLEKIRQIMQARDYDMVAALKDQKKLLEIKNLRTENLLKTISLTITNLQRNQPMNQNNAFSAFTDPTYQKYKDEVEQKWGTTNTYKQSMERVGKMTKEEFERVKQEGSEITVAIAELMKNGITADNEQVQRQIGRFYQHLHHFYDPSLEMFKALGQGYVDDPRFTKTYEDIATGLAVFMRDAMVYYANQTT